MYNILDKRLEPYKNIPIKECREIVFSHGGNLFACQNDKEIWVYKFYTASIPAQFKFSAHTQPVKRICWLEDDSGFISCGQDAMIYVWKLYPGPLGKNTNHNMKEEQNPVWSFKHQKISFSSVATFKPSDPKESLEPILYAAGSDRSIREIKDKSESLRYEENCTYSQILVGNQRRIIVAGVSESDRPGSIQIFRYEHQA